MENLTEKIVNDEKEEEEETEVVVEEKEQAYPKLKSKVEILDVLFHPTESNILTLGLINGKIKIYDLSKQDKRLVSAKKFHKKSIRKIAYPTENSDLIFTASKDKSIQLNDLKHEANILTIEGAHNAPINCMKVIDNWLVATADDDGCVKVWIS